MDGIQLPAVGVLPCKEFRGMQTLQDTDVSSLEVASFEEAFRDPWPTDAHFVTYAPSDPIHWPWPRCNKPLLPQLRVGGVDLVTTMWVLDYDTPRHALWTRESLDEFMVRFHAAAQLWPLAGMYSLFYTTRKGARVIYNLSHPMPVDESEARYPWLVQQWTALGFPMDPVCGDWTRVFRLPFVMREGRPTWEDTLPVMVLEQFDRTLDIRGILPTVPVVKTQYGEIIPLNEDKPTPEDACGLMHQRDAVTGRERQTEWYKFANRRLKGRDCYPCVFDNAALAQPTDRNNTIHKYVGEATALLARDAQATPQGIYALFIHAVEQLEPDSDTSDWTEILWSAVSRLWSKETAKIEIELAARQQTQVETRSVLQRIIDGMKQWCDSPYLHHTDPEVVEQWVKGRLIVSCGNTYMVMGSEGYYEKLQLTDKQLIRRIRIMGLDALIPTRYENDRREWVDITVAGLVNNYCTIVADMKGIPCIAGGYLENVDTPDARAVVPCYRRDPKLEAQYSPDVDMWLHKLFGENYAKACEWLAWSLAFEEGPICALSISGGHGVGKKLLVQGLSECLEEPLLADATDLVSEHQYGLMNSPFLVVNEGWPRSQKGKHPADQFRHLVSGDPFRVYRKYLAPVDIRNPVRIIITANNHEVVGLLTGDRDLSPNDRDALAVRLLHFDVDAEASKWLQQRGGMAYTGRKGARWIEGDGGQASDKIVAKHFYWLYTRRGAVKEGKRYLVDGGNSDELMLEMRTRSGSAPLVIEAILRLLEVPGSRKGLFIDKKAKTLYVLTSEVLQFFRSQMSGTTKEVLSAKKISDVFRSLMTVEPPRGTRIIEDRKEIGHKRWYELDPELLLMVARRDGWTCPPLEQLVFDRQDPQGARDWAAAIAESERTKMPIA